MSVVILFPADEEFRCPVMMFRTVSSSPLAPSVKVKLITAGFHTAADLTDVQQLQLCKGTLLCKNSLNQCYS